MNPQPIEKAFDCIAFKREAQQRIYEEIKDFTVEEQIAYFRKAEETGPLAEWCKSVRQAQALVQAESSEDSEEDQADWLERENLTIMAIPKELVSSVRELIAKYRATSSSHHGAECGT
jgi:hypothetical protein